MKNADFDHEPVRGLPARLPPGEALLWQGSPGWWQTARGVFHVPLVAAYLGLFPAWTLASAILDGAPPMATALNIAVMLGLIVACCAILAALAYAVARTTVYSVTGERVVMRYGVAFPMALNIPFAKIEAAAMKELGGGRGDIALTLARPGTIGWLMLWPHSRPWHFRHPQPMLRGVSEARSVAAVLGQALAAAASRPSARGTLAAAGRVPAASRHEAGGMAAPALTRGDTDQRIARIA